MRFTFAKLSHKRFSVLSWTVNAVMLAAIPHDADATLAVLLLVVAMLATPVWSSE